MTVSAAPVGRSRRRRRTRILFWIRRYLPAEIAGTTTLLLLSWGTSAFTSAPVLLALAALIGETIGFYGVLGYTVYREQAAVVGGGPRRPGRIILRTLALLVAEFGPSELLDSLLLRPALLIVGALLFENPIVGLLVGKVAADVVFYTIAAVAYTVTDRLGVRDGSRERRATRVEVAA